MWFNVIQYNSSALVCRRYNTDQLKHEFITSKFKYTHLAVHLANVLLWPPSARTRTNRVQPCLLIKLYNSWTSCQQLWISSSSTLNYTATSMHWKSGRRSKWTLSWKSTKLWMRNYKNLCNAALNVLNELAMVTNYLAQWATTLNLSLPWISRALTFCPALRWERKHVYYWTARCIETPQRELFLVELIRHPL